MNIPILSSIAKFGLTIITLSSRLEKNETKVAEIEKNYLSRFEDIKEHVNSSEKNIIDRIYQSEISILKQISK